jgi:predicted Zn-dependent protease
MGYSTQAAWAGYSSAVSTAISSFARVTDAAVLGVQPLRLDIVTVSEPMSLSSFHGRNSPAISVEELAELNRTTPGAVMSAGSRIKTVVGQPIG